MGFLRIMLSIPALLSIWALQAQAQVQGGSLAVPFREMKGSPLTIIDGDVAEKGEFPYQAGLFVDYHVFCGGALISERWVLTAGHCVSGYSTWVVYLGGLNILQPQEQDRHAFVTRSGILHPEYQFPLIDIALIELMREATLTKYVQVISLPPSTSASYLGQEATASGWGKTSDNAVTISSKLMYVTLNVTELQFCRDTYNNPAYGDGLICAVGVSDRATCKGDSGGPLAISDEDDGQILIGLTSFGHKAGCSAEYPNGFTNVAHFVTWISEIANITLT